MDLLAAWLVFPLVLLVFTFGVGLLVDWLAGGRLPMALLVPVGLATLLATSRLTVALEETAPFTLPLVVLLAAGGFAAGWRRLIDVRLDVPAIAAIVGAAAVYGAPVLLSGEPTFAGFALLPDTAHQLTLASFLPNHGTDWQSLTDSSYKFELRKYLATAYPIAPQALLGALSPLGALEVAWLYHPFLAFVAGTLACSLYALICPWVDSRPLRAAVAFVAAQPALAVGFALQGSIKELTGCAMLVLVVALAARALHERWQMRALLPLAAGAAAALGSLGPSAAPYLAAALAVPAAIWAWRLMRPIRLGELAYATAVAALTVVLALPVVTSASTAYEVNTATLENAEDLGNLAGPLHLVQVSGVWLNGDYRYEPATYRWLNWLVTGFALTAAALGFLWALRRRATGPLLLIGGLGIPSIYLLSRGSPYADAKVVMLVSPAVLALAALAPLLFARSFRRLPAILVGVGLLSAVLLSNALAYHDVQHAPYDRYAELLELNESLAGQGPTLLTEYDEFGEYLLRDALPYVQPEYPHRYLPGGPYREGNGLFDPAHRPSLKTPLDLDDLEISYVESVPNLVVRRSPTVSRPPSNYRLAWRGRWYELWQRRKGTGGRVLAHLPGGRNVFEPGGTVRCRDVLRLARRGRRVGGRLAYVPRPMLATMNPLKQGLPPGWFQYGAYPDAIVPVGPGVVVGPVRTRSSGGYRVWVEGSFGRGVEVQIDGRRVGAITYHQGNPGQYLTAGKVRLSRGRHLVTLVAPGGDFRPGNGGTDSSLRHIGPVVLSPPANEDPAVRHLPVNRARELCGRWVDWVELVVPT